MFNFFAPSPKRAEIFSHQLGSVRTSSTFPGLCRWPESTYIISALIEISEICTPLSKATKLAKQPANHLSTTKYKIDALAMKKKGKGAESRSRNISNFSQQGVGGDGNSPLGDCGKGGGEGPHWPAGYTGWHGCRVGMGVMEGVRLMLDTVWPLARVVVASFCVFVSLARFFFVFLLKIENNFFCQGGDPNNIFCQGGDPMMFIARVGIR